MGPSLCPNSHATQPAAYPAAYYHLYYTLILQQTSYDASNLNPSCPGFSPDGSAVSLVPSFVLHSLPSLFFFPSLSSSPSSRLHGNVGQIVRMAEPWTHSTSIRAQNRHSSPPLCQGSSQQLLSLSSFSRSSSPSVLRLPVASLVSVPDRVPRCTVESEAKTVVMSTKLPCPPCYSLIRLHSYLDNVLVSQTRLPLRHCGLLLRIAVGGWRIASRTKRGEIGPMRVSTACKVAARWREVKRKNQM